MSLHRPFSWAIDWMPSLSLCHLTGLRTTSTLHRGSVSQLWYATRSIGLSSRQRKLFLFAQLASRSAPSRFRNSEGGQQKGSACMVREKGRRFRLNPLSLPPTVLPALPLMTALFDVLGRQGNTESCNARRRQSTVRRLSVLIAVKDPLSTACGSFA